MSEERMNQPLDDFRENVRDMKSLFWKLSVDGQDEEGSPSSSHTSYTWWTFWDQPTTIVLRHTEVILVTLSCCPIHATSGCLHIASHSLSELRSSHSYIIDRIPDRRVPENSKHRLNTTNFTLTPTIPTGQYHSLLPHKRINPSLWRDVQHPHNLYYLSHIIYINVLISPPHFLPSLSSMPCTASPPVMTLRVYSSFIYPTRSQSNKVHIPCSQVILVIIPRNSGTNSAGNRKTDPIDDDNGSLSEPFQCTFSLIVSTYCSPRIMRLKSFDTLRLKELCNG